MARIKRTGRRATKAKRREKKNKMKLSEETCIMFCGMIAFLIIGLIYLKIEKGLAYIVFFLAWIAFMITVAMLFDDKYNY